MDNTYMFICVCLGNDTFNALAFNALYIININQCKYMRRIFKKLKNELSKSILNIIIMIVNIQFS